MEFLVTFVVSLVVVFGSAYIGWRARGTWDRQKADDSCKSCEGTGLIGGPAINDRCDDCNGTGRRLK